MYSVNFCAGPAQLPKHIYAVLSQMILNYQNTGLSILSISHRDQIFAIVNNNIKKHLKALLNLTEDYEILLMSGGASAQFAAIPMNLKRSGKALYFNSGYWASVAIKEAEKFMALDVLKGVDTAMHSRTELYDYVHYTENETIDGVQWQEIPKTSCPLVCDMSSSFLSKPIDITQYDLIYAGAQKNIGLPGVTVVIIKKSLIDRMVNEEIPAVLSYKTMQQAESLYNTPDVFSWVAMELVLTDLIKQGGLKAVAHKNAQKAALLYQTIDASAIFHNVVAPKNRSQMNIVFQLAHDQLTMAFLEFADKKGVYGIAGHRSIGGIRVSLYNAIELSELKQLITVMQEFEASVNKKQTVQE